MQVLKSGKGKYEWLLRLARTAEKGCRNMSGVTSRVTLGQVLMFWAKLVGHCSPAEIVQSVNVNQHKHCGTSHAGSWRRMPQVPPH